MAQTKYIDGIRSLSNVYTPSHIRTIVDTNSLSIFKKKYHKYKSIFSSTDHISQFKESLKLIYNEMIKNYKNEYVYKNTILNKLLLGKYSLKTTTLLNEFKIGKSVADIILINGEVKLFEIKTDLDNLDRLDTQLENYKTAVEKIYIVTNYKHINKLKERYFDKNFGIIEFTKRKTLKTHKEAIADKVFFDHKTIFKLLRKEEYLSIIKNAFGNIPDVPNTKIYRVCLNKAKEINPTDFQKSAFNQIRSRKIISPQLLKNNKTPYELKYLCYTLDFNKSQYKKLYNLLETSI